MTSDLQQTRYDQLIRRVGGIIGPGSKVSEALSELFPTIDVELVPGELLLLGGTSICQGSATLTADAGERPRIQLFNPVGSGLLATVTTVMASTSSTTTFRVATNNTALTDGVGTEVFRDRRRAGTDLPTCQIRTDSTVAAVDAHLTFLGLSNINQILKDPNTMAVLPPGSGIEVGTTTLAGNLTCNYLWRERVAEQSELNF